MPTHVALLRGINVGRSTRIAMADLRSVVADLGHTEVATYLQSGTVVLSPADDREPSALAARLSTAADDPTTVHAAVQQEPLTPDEQRVLERVLAEEVPTSAATT